MDLTFTRKGGLMAGQLQPVRRLRVPAASFLIARAAAAQAASPTASAVAHVLRGQDHGDDWVQELAQIFAPRSGGMIEAVASGGCFNPTIASRLGVGQPR